MSDLRSGEYVPDRTECIIAIMNELGKQAKALLIQLCVAYVRPTSHFVIKNSNAISRHVHRQHMRACMRTYIYLNYLYSFAVLGYGSSGMMDHAIPEGRVDARINKIQNTFYVRPRMFLGYAHVHQPHHAIRHLSRNQGTFVPRVPGSLVLKSIGSLVQWFVCC